MNNDFYMQKNIPHVTDNQRVKRSVFSVCSYILGLRVRIIDGLANVQAAEAREARCY